MFRAHFRMTRTTFESLLQLIGPFTTINTNTVSIERRTLACLWYLSNQETFRGVADRFGVSKGSLHYYLGNFCRVMSGENVLPSLVYWPQHHDYPRIQDGFATRGGFPGVIGAIDGTYIPIQGPTQFRESYICRKGFPAFHLQGVCDSNLLFTDVFCAYPGSVHDARVFRNSSLREHLEQEVSDDYHLIGDSAYGLCSYLVVPFRDNGHLTPEQKHFNLVHSSTRVDIERCFGLLKGKFRKLKHLDINKVSVIPFVIVTCCALHNFILRNESYPEDEIHLQEQEEDEATNGTGNGDNYERTTTGLAKRNSIMYLLA